MFTRSAAWGVNLVGGSVRAVHVERRGDRYRILDALDQPISPAGEGAEPLRAHLPETVGRALTDLLLARRATLADPVFVAMPSFGGRHGRLEVPGADPDKVRGLLDYELHHALKGDREAWLVRMGTPAPHARDGVTADFHAQRRELVQTFVGDVRRFGLPLDGLIPGPLALARYAELEWPTPHGGGRQLVLEVQRTRTELLYMSVIGPRWRSLNFGCGTLEAANGDAIAREVDQLAARLLREHDEASKAFFAAQDAAQGKRLERVILLGDAARHPELKKALRERFQVELVSPQASRHFPQAESRVLDDGTVLGLALAALADGSERGARRRDDSYVAPPPARRAQRWLPALSAALLLLALGLLATRLLADRTVAQLESQLAQLRQQVNWSAAADFDEARAGAVAAAGESSRIVARAAVLRRQLDLPRRVLEALGDPSSVFRLVSLQIEPRADAQAGDELSLTLESDHRVSGAAERIKSLFERRAADPALPPFVVTGVETSDGEHGSLRAAVRLQLRKIEASP